MVIRPARPEEHEALRAIEQSASQPFRTLGMDAVADHAPPSRDTLERAREAHRLLVVADTTDAPVGYLMWEPVDGTAHVEQVSVDPSHAGQRLGAALLDQLAMDQGTLTLTTFRDVPWNAPYYRRLGFVEVDASALGPELTRLVVVEAARIPGDAARVVMRRPG